MCRKAKEIQKLSIGLGDTTIKPIVIDNGNWFCVDRLHVVWLPRQDQLYELHTPSDSKEFSAYGLGRLFGIWLFNNKGYTHEQLFNSIEQHLLAFVMYDIHMKIWNGHEWIKHNTTYEKTTLSHKTSESQTCDVV